MNKGIFIIGTGTDVGKTYVTALIIKKMREAKYNVGYYKAALSGAQRTESGLHIGDACYVKTIASLESDCVDMVSYVYETPVSPHLAAKLESNPVTLEKIIDDYEKQYLKYEYITVEGSGGIICPIRYDKDEQIFLEDIIKVLKLPTIIVTDARLGTINATALTAWYLESKNIQVQGIIMNYYCEGIMEDDNIRMIETITKIPVIALVRDGDLNIDINVDTLEALYGEESN